MRILIVAGNAFAAEAIRRELRHVSGCRVIGYVDSRRPCGLAILEAAPDVVLIDDAGPSDAVLAAVREARATASDRKLVLLTTRMDRSWLAEASAAGIDAAVAKTAPPATVGLLIREVASDHIFTALTPEAANTEVRSEDLGLTTRELEILRLVAAGGSNSSIARGLWVAEQTVKFHLSNIYRKLGVTNRTEASHFAHVHGLITSHASQQVALRSAA